jgi:hypothetical protein
MMFGTATGPPLQSKSFISPVFPDGERKVGSLRNDPLRRLLAFQERDEQKCKRFCARIPL